MITMEFATLCLAKNVKSYSSGY